MTEDELRTVAASMGFVVVRKAVRGREFCRLGHPLKWWPSGEHSCPTCKAEGVNRRRAAARAAIPLGGRYNEGRMR